MLLSMLIILIEKNFWKNHKFWSKIDFFTKKDEFERGLMRVDGWNQSHWKEHNFFYQEMAYSVPRRSPENTKNRKKWLLDGFFLSGKLFAWNSQNWNNETTNGLLHCFPGFIFREKVLIISVMTDQLMVSWSGQSSPRWVMNDL